MSARLYRVFVTHRVPFVFFCAVLVLSAVYFIAIQSHSIELSFDQLSAFERQVQTIGNNSVYVVEPPKRDEIFSSLGHEDWAKVASRIDYVAFFYDDMYSIIGRGNWISLVSESLAKLQPPGYGIVLFSCGCVIPNVIFTNTQTRFDGYECTMLPGFVMQKEHVRFIEVDLPEQGCKNRDAVLAAHWYETNAWKLEDARNEHDRLRTKLLSQHN